VSQPLVLEVPPGSSPRAGIAELAAAVETERWPLLLDSGATPSDLAAWHLLLFDPVERLQHRVRAGAHGFRELAAALQRHWPRESDRMPGGASALPAFRGGAAGWFGYELARELERVPELAAVDADVPDLCAGLYPFALAEELGTGRRLIVGRGSAADAARFLASVEELARRARPLSPLQPAPPGRRLALESTFSRQAYVAAVAAVRERILDGDVYQVNLCQRLAAPFDGDPAALQLAWRERFPAPFGALLRVPGTTLLSSSPELFLRKRGARVESRPIKGTAARHADPAADAAARAALEASDKERAELAMIVDVVRNDLGRTAVIGSVAVEGEFRTDAWANLYHRVATVSSLVDPGTSALDVLEAAFPPASVTGAPKLAAQAVIERLEPVRRHVYTGAIGWIGADGDMDLSVAIRIATLTGGRLLGSFGGGITLASDPAAEYDETLHKARALCDVLGARGPFTGALP